MAEHQSWRYYTSDGRWVCPFCLNPVAKRPGLPIHDAAGTHLARCAAYADGQGVARPESEVSHRVRLEQVAQVAINEPAWRIYDHEGIWWCPGCLNRIPAVRLGAGGVVSTFTTRALTEHASACQILASGTTHTAAEVSAAAERGTWMLSAERVVRGQIGFPSWRYATKSGAWICPCCLAATAEVLIRRGAVDLEFLITGMTRHLAMYCPAVRSMGRFEPRSEDDVRDAAIRAEPGATTTVRMPRPMGDGRAAQGLRTPLHSSALRRPPDSGPESLPEADSDPLIPQVVPAAPVVAPVVKVNRVRPGSSPLPLAPSTDPDPALSRELDHLTRASSTPPSGMPSPAFIPTPVPMAVDPEDDHHLTGTDALPAWLREPEAGVVTDPDGADLAWMDTAELATPDPVIDSLERTDVLRARDLQEEMLQDVPTLDGWHFATRFEPCSEVSGDFYQFMDLGGGRVGFAIGDVSGHGVRAGLIMSMAKKTLEIFAGLDLGPADTLAKVNQALAKDLGGKHFISMCYGVLNPAESTVTWARAGHPPPLLLRADGSLEEIKPRGMVVGMKSGSLFREVLTEETSVLHPGDLVLLYTDGITEAMNRTQEEFSEERLIEIMRGTAGQGAERLCTEIMNRVRGFRGGGAPSDDLTLLAMAREA